MKAVVYRGLERAAVPSGASTGTHEALELRDGGASSGDKFLQKPTGMVVGYFEADHIELAQPAIARTETTASWKRAMSQFFAAPDGGVNEVLPQYFHLA
jgi:L-rhamnose mutarotase